MPHSDFLAWLSSATLKIFISGVSSRILMLYKANLVYSLNRLRRRPQIKDDLKNDDDLKNEDNLKSEGQLISNWKCYQMSKPEMELHMINTIYAALPVRTNRKDDIFMQRRLVQNFTIILE